ncbi:hypothetical protein ABIC56_002970 [Acinetobacter bereziniae]|uniref:DUF4760 domain-containing protein n=1 Tax=Acinetobacter bereziniae TaxID=106648 RepID=UPI00285A7F4C|nr:DUF4760 domain-containing protein [Acinetobacter bereziniae]MDR6542995.1 hypothetical protein [Acinetobacter bereziniae]
MANSVIIKIPYTSRLTFLIALSAFLISIYLSWPKIVNFYDFKEWQVGDWLLFLQLLVVFVSALIAFMTIKASKNSSRERATLDTILNDNNDRDLSLAKVLVLNFDKNPLKYLETSKEDFSKANSREPCVSLSELCEFDPNKLTKIESDIRRHMIHVLNRHEFYAIGINTNLLDEKLFKRMHCNNIINLWEAVSPAVTHLRKKSQKTTYYKELELLALRWSENPLVENDLKK